jgi:hypothetical protein
MMAASRRATRQMSTQTPSPFDGGVREHTDWANDIVQDVGRDLTRLANLAVDDNKRDPSRTVDAHYRYRLNLLLNDKHQRIIYGDIGVPPLPTTPTDAVTPTPHHPRSIHASYVNWSEFKELKDRVDDLNRLVKQLSDMHSTSQQEINSLKADVAVLKKAVGCGSDGSKKENDPTKMM